jgi:ribulose-phosphate 3-epimerase
MSWPVSTREGEIEPSIYAADFRRLGAQLKQLLDAGARIFHFDVGDGHFVDEITMGPIVLESISCSVHKGGGVLDCHLMVSQPASHLEQVRSAGGDSITFHVGAVEDPVRTIAAARELGLAIGVALNPGTPLDGAILAGQSADLVLCMGIQPGLSGQELMPATFDRVAKLRAALPQNVLVQVDGGVHRENVAALIESGANLLVSGSGVFWQEDPAIAYAELAAVTQAAQRIGG